MLLKTVSEQVFDTFLTQIVALVADRMEVNTDTTNIIAVLLKEAHQFQKTIAHGQKLLDELIQWATKKIISGKDIFKLYDTFGFPLELTKEIVEEHWLSLDITWFEAEMQLQQERSRAWSKDMFKQWVDRANYLQGIPATIFVWYAALETEYMQLLKDFEVNG